jgi:hypothetical protein
MGFFLRILPQSGAIGRAWERGAAFDAAARTGGRIVSSRLDGRVQSIVFLLLMFSGANTPLLREAETIA